MGTCSSSTANERERSHMASSPSVFEDLNTNDSSNLAVHQGSVLGIASRGNVVASCGDDKTISITERQKLEGTPNYSPLHLLGHEKAVNRIHFDTNSDFLFSASRDLSIRLWTASNNYSEVHCIPKAHSLNISAITAHKAHPNRMFSASRDYSVKYWDITRAIAGITSTNTTNTITNTSEEPLVSSIAEYHAPRNIVTSLTTCAYETELLYQGSEDLCVRVWDLRQSAATVPAIHLTGYVYFPLCLDRQQFDGGYLLASGTKGFNSVGCGVMVWDMRQTAKPLIEFAGHSQDVTAVQFAKHPTRSENILYSACKDGTFMIWDTNTLQQRGSYRFDGNKLLSCMTVLDHETEKVQPGGAVEEEIVVGAMDGSLTILGVSGDGANDQELNVRTILSTAITVQAD